MLFCAACNTGKPAPAITIQHIYGNWHSLPAKQGSMSLFISEKDHSYTESCDGHTYQADFCIVNDTVIALGDKSNTGNYRVVVFDSSGNFHFKPYTQKLRSDIELSYLFTFTPGKM